MSAQMTSLDTRAFRRALGNFATGVTVMTASSPSGERAGVTANSFNSVSLDPPLILWSIDKRSGSCKVFERASHFAVNILAADQVDLSNRFARPGEDKFAGLENDLGAGGAPILRDCAAVFQCCLHDIVEGGDHWILIGRVVAFDDVGRAPLLYHQGGYSAVLPHSRLPGDDKSEAAAAKALDGRLQDNYFYLMTQAVRAYQQDYQPRQLSTGLRTSEARMLMVLDQDRERELDIDTLLREVDMPRREIENAVDILSRKGLVSHGEGCCRITQRGREQAAALWEIAAEEQEKVFGRFTPEELRAFKKVLSSVMHY